MIYIALIVVLIIQYMIYTEPKWKRITYVFLWLVLSIVIAFRDHRMADYIGYMNSYKSIGHYSSRYEPLFYSIGVLCKNFDFDFLSYLFVIGLISCFVKLLAIKKLSKFATASVIIWLADLFVLQDMIAIRAALAQGILLLSVYYRVEKKYLLTTILAITSIGFHYSSAAFIPFFILSNKKDFRWLYLILIPLSYIFVLYSGHSLYYLVDFISIMQLQDLNDMYSSATTELNIFNLYNLSKTLICILLWSKIDTIKEHNKYSVILLKLYTIGCICVPLFYEKISVATRFSELFCVTEIILFPLIIYCFPNFFTNIGLRKFLFVVISVVLSWIVYTEYMTF